MRFGDRQEAAVPMCSYGKNQGLSRQHGQLTDKLSRVSHEQTRLLLSIDHPLVHMQRARDDKLHTHFLKDTHI